MELLVVLVVVSLVAAFVVPNVQRLSERHTLASQRHSLRSQIDGLGYRAYSTGTPFELSGAGQTLPGLTIPPGWKLEIPNPIFYSHTGVCSGGVVHMTAPDGSRERLDLQHPLCTATEETPRPG